MRVTGRTVFAAMLSPEEWRREMNVIREIVGARVVARISGHVRALEDHIDALRAAQHSEQQDPRQR